MPYTYSEATKKATLKWREHNREDWNEKHNEHSKKYYKKYIEQRREYGKAYYQYRRECDYKIVAKAFLKILLR